MLKKRGALALSINAIVILIIAITMLGLALGFTRGMFGKVSTQIEEKISEEPEAPQATAQIPVTLSREAIVTQVGQEEIIKVGAYNPSGVQWPNEAPTLTCSGLGQLTSNANPKTLNPTDQTSYTVLIEIPTAAAQTYLCKVTMPSLGNVPGLESYYKELTIKITQ